jgi:hypothetical protein
MKFVGCEIDVKFVPITRRKGWYPTIKETLIYDKDIESTPW